MKPKFYSAIDLDILIHMLESVLQDWKMFTGLKKSVLQKHPWLSPVMGPMSEEENFIETSNHGKVQTKLVTLPTGAEETLPALMLEITLPERCIVKDGESQWGGFRSQSFLLLPGTSWGICAHQHEDSLL